MSASAHRTIRTQQLLMRPIFGNFAFDYDINPMCLAYQAQPVVMMKTVRLFIPNLSLLPARRQNGLHLCWLLIDRLIPREARLGREPRHRLD
jgi:hypothetical protein